MNLLFNNLKNRKQAIIHLQSTLTFVAIFLSIFSHAEPTETQFRLQLKPNQCVALNQGQNCFVNLELNWTANQQGNYCLFSSQQVDALQCWHNSANGEFKKEFMFNQNVFFTLKENDKESVLASTELKMAWVYRKNSKPQSSWRMF